MKKNFKSLSLILIIGIALIACNQNDYSQNENESRFTDLKGPYLGQKPPGMTPELFAPGLLSAGGDEANITFTPDGMELCYTLWTPGLQPGGIFQRMIIMNSRIVNNNWTEPKEFSFNPDRKEIYPFFSPDGERIYFVSYRKSPPLKMYVEKLNGEWCEPKEINFKDNSKNSSFLSVASNHNLYFSSSSLIYKYPYENGEYTIPEKLNNVINVVGGGHHPYIAPDESYIIFDFDKSGDSFGQEDLFISFRDQNGEWMEAQNMGKFINTEYRDKRAFVSFDGKYLFFSSNRIQNSELPNDAMTLKELQQLMQLPANGNEHIYWVDAKVIEELKPDHLK